MIAEFYEDEKNTREEQEITLGRALGRLMPFLREQRKRLAYCLGLLIVVTVMSLAWPWLLQGAIDGPLNDQVTGSDLEAAFMTLLGIGLIVVLLQIATIVLQYVQRVKLEVIGQNIMLQLKQKLFDHILSLDVPFFDKHPVGRLMARVESDTESLRMLFTNTVVLIVGDVIMMIGIYSIMLYVHWKLALTLIVFLPLLAVLTWIFHRLTTHRFLEVRKRMAEVTATLTEYLQGMSIVQIFHRGDWASERVFRVNERKFSEDAWVNIAVCVFFNLLFYFEWVKIGIVLLMGAVWDVSAGTIVMFIILIWKEFDPIARTADQLGTFQKGLAGARRIFAILAIEPKVVDPVQPVRWESLKEGIRFENVWFSYSDDDNWVLRDVSFEIPVGQRIALAGVTGGGKSTVISLLLRLYDPQKGRITVDGIDIRNITKADLRRRFGLVLQDIILFPGNVASNIGLESETVSHEQIVTACLTVAADPVIRKLPDGYQSTVSEKGSNFSRGERQLLSFARALAVDPDLLILDEATSSVDPETERTIQASLTKLMANRTSLIIAHRLSTILDVDRILVIRYGKIIEQGTHIELLLQDGYYSKLFHLQFKNRNGVASDAG
ncbi:MAG: ABC transporter ATP-binding protein/permease [candidate division Zixibacteria bacterium]|nr:ABC transporter ATP-binding protein/permease [candidate division Zixibacteria bacterium]